MPDGQIASYPASITPSAACKKYRFAITPNQNYKRGRLVPFEGRSRSSRTRDGMQWTLMCRWRTACEADGEVVWFW